MSQTISATSGNSNVGGTNNFTTRPPANQAGENTGTSSASHRGSDGITVSPEALEIADSGERCGSDHRCLRALLERGLLT